jgi:hypothetical protein
MPKSALEIRAVTEVARRKPTRPLMRKARRAKRA